MVVAYPECIIQSGGGTQNGVIQNGEGTPSSVIQSGGGTPSGVIYSGEGTPLGIGGHIPGVFFPGGLIPGSIDSTCSYRTIPFLYLNIICNKFLHLEKQILKISKK